MRIKFSTHKRTFLHECLLEQLVLCSCRFCRLQLVCTRQEVNREEADSGQVRARRLRECDQRSAQAFGPGSLGALILVQMKVNWCVGLGLSCSSKASRPEPSGHLVGNWEREVRWMDFHRYLTLTELGNGEQCCNPTLILALWMLTLARSLQLKTGYQEGNVKLMHLNKETKAYSSCMYTDQLAGYTCKIYT